MLSDFEYRLNWSSGRVFGKDIPRDIIKKKYELYEDALESSDQAKLGELLQDDTIFARATLKWEGQPIKLRYYQDAIVSDTHRRIDVEAANQQGKSFSLCVKAAVKFLQSHGKNVTIGLISKSMPQNGMNMRVVTKMLKESGFAYTPGGNDNMMVKTHNFSDGTTNTLVCAVASTSALGYPFDYLLLDEFEFWENPEGLEYMYDQVLEPRTFHTRGQIVIYSNPNGKNFVSERLHKRTLPDDSFQFHVYNINFLDNPDNTREEWELKKSHMHPIIFASTMAAERAEAEGAALTRSDIESTRDDELTEKNLHLVVDKESYWFLDLGFVNDQSVLVGGWSEKDEGGKLVFKFAVKVYPQQHPIPELWNQKLPDSVPSQVKRFGNNLQMFDLDITGKEGNEVLANEAGLNAGGVKMTGQWKATHYERFITLCKQGRIKVSWCDNWVSNDNKSFEFQARSLKISTKMPDGRTRPYPLYHHEKESDHDDILDAVVGCLSLMDDDMNPTPGATYIPSSRINNNEAVKEKEEQIKIMNKNPDIAGFDDEESTLENSRRHEQFYGGMNIW